jgi:branched-chain amino acid transport system permease protein
VFVDLTISGLALGSVYALIALGLVMIYKATEVVNFAQGELLMIGAYIGYTFIVTYELPIFLSIGAMILIMAILGIIIQKIIIRPMIGESVFATILVTFGLSFILRSVAGFIWSWTEVAFPSLLPTKNISILDIRVSSSHLWIVIITLFLIFLLGLFFKYTELGKVMRAVSQNQLTASLVGIDIEKIFGFIWCLSAVVASIAGILLSPILILHPNMGLVVLKAFPAAILGGFGSIPGAILGGFIIGISENLAGGFLGEGLKDIFAWIVLIAVLLVRPEGLFGVESKKKV